MSTCARCHCPVSQFVTDPADMRRVCPCVVSWHEMWREEKQVSEDEFEGVLDAWQEASRVA